MEHPVDGERESERAEQDGEEGLDRRRVSRSVETRSWPVGGALVGPGKAQETFLDETRAHRGNEGVTVPVKLRSVREPTNESQRSSDRPGAQDTWRTVFISSLKLKLRLPSEEIPDIWYYTRHISSWSPLYGGMGLVRYRARIVLGSSRDSLHGE